jgi:hypothetical protein
MPGREIAGRSYPEIGPDAHHPISHYQNDPDTLAKLAKINQFTAASNPRHPTRTGRWTTVGRSQLRRHIGQMSMICSALPSPRESHG